MTQSPQSFHIALMAALAMPELGSVPEWVHILPAGPEVPTYDGRGPYRYADGAAIIAASLSRKPRLVVDENHSTEIEARQGRSSPARGYVTAMESRVDGIWAQVDWNPSGRALLSDRAYWGLSPVIEHDAQGRIALVRSIALTNEPNLRGLAALNQENSMNDMERLAEAMGLEAGATVDQMIDAIKAMKTAKTDTATAAMQSAIGEIGVALGVQQGADLAAIVAAANAAKTAGRSEVAALQSELAAVTTRLNGITESASRERATTFVDGEIKRGRVGIKPLRDHYISMHMAEAARVEKEIGAMPVLGASGAAVLPPTAKDGQVSLNAEQTAVAKALGVDLKTYAATLQAEQKETV
jgi:phage I-like protein